MILLEEGFRHPMFCDNVIQGVLLVGSMALQMGSPGPVVAMTMSYVCVLLVGSMALHMGSPGPVVTMTMSYV